MMNQGVNRNTSKPDDKLHCCSRITHDDKASCYLETHPNIMIHCIVSQVLHTMINMLFLRDTANIMIHCIALEVLHLRLEEVVIQ